MKKWMFFSALAVGACSSGQPKEVAQNEVQRELSSAAVAADGLPAPSDVKEYFDFLRDLRLDDDRVQFADGAGGMSINLEFKTPWGMGDFLSLNPDGTGDNGAGQPEGQVLAYNLSRIFGYSKHYGRGSWYTISGRSVTILKGLANATNPRNVHVRKAKERVLQSTQNSTVTGSISLYGPKPYNLSAFERISASPNGGFNTDHAMAKFIQATGPKPSNSLTTIGNYRMNEAETAKVLSTVFLIDALTEQWDRFSGGNIQVAKSGDTYYLVSYDNGGAGVPGWSPGYVRKYLGWTTRFDAKVAQQILAMNRFVNENASNNQNYLGFSDKEGFLKALGLKKFKSQFKRHLATTAEHVKRTFQTHGESKATF